MRSLIDFFIRYRLVATFLIFQVISLTFLFHSNSFHRTTFLNSSTSLIGRLYELRSGITDYFDLKKANEKLATEIARLRNLERRSFIMRDARVVEIEDTVYHQRYQYLSAKVINSSLDRQNNYITLNRGRIHGVQPEMGVIGPNGIVGMVKDVSEHFCTVLPVLHSNFYASVRFKDAHYFGLLEWGGQDPRYARIVDVAKHAKVSEGDTVVTRGASTIYPSGILVGTVRKVSSPASGNYHEIEVELSTDFAKLYYVFIVKNVLKGEQQQLEKETQQDVQ